MIVKQIDEAARLAALKRYEILDTAPEAAFDHITALVKLVMGVPIVAVSLVDQDRQWFKSQIGLAVSETPRDISFCTHTIGLSKPLLVSDAHLDTRFRKNPLVQGDPFIRSYLGVPLTSFDGHNLGSLCVIDTAPRSYSVEQVKVLSGFADLVRKEIELRKVADHDELTGLLSRRALTSAMAPHVDQFRLRGATADLIYLDLDRFKLINDSLGHLAGDVALREIAVACRKLLGAEDLFGRIGGDEFVIVAPGRSAEGTRTLAEKLLQVVSELAITGLGDSRITTSIGIATLSASCASIPSWLAAADGALYVSKAAGRNRFTHAGGRPLSRAA